MAYKIPGQIFMNGKNVKFTVDNDMKDLGKGEEWKELITINLKGHEDKSITALQDTVLHEAVETLCDMINCRYVATGQSLIIIDHDKFQHSFIPNLLSIIKQLDFGSYEKPAKKKK